MIVLSDREQDSLTMVRDLFAGQLFEEWARKEDLYPTETYLLRKYLRDMSKRVLEAGTGGGRITFFVERLGFTDLHAFDFVPRMIAFAESRAAARNSRATFKVANAANLEIYPSETFDYLIYLQQILCFLPAEYFPAAVREAFRIARPEGVAIFSFMNWDSRKFNRVLSSLVNFVRVLRNETPARYYLPYMKINGRPNVKFLCQSQPSVLWVRKDDIVTTLRDAGFSIIEARTDLDINGKNTAIYIVCKKGNGFT